MPWAASRFLRFLSSGFQKKPIRKSWSASSAAVYQKCRKRIAALSGGHSIRTDDLLFGYAVTGTIHPEKIWRNVGARTGDVLLSRNHSAPA